MDGDVTLQPAFLAAARRLLSPCAALGTSVPARDSLVRSLEHEPQVAARDAAIASQGTPVAPWLAAVALLLLLAEPLVRRSARTAP